MLDNAREPYDPSNLKFNIGSVKNSNSTSSARLIPNQI